MVMLAEEKRHSTYSLQNYFAYSARD